MKYKIVIGLLFIFVTVALDNIESKTELNDIYADSIVTDSINSESTENKIEKAEENSELEIIQKRINDISLITDKKQQLLEFKKLQYEYPDVFEKYGTLDNYFTEKELNLFFKVVEAEITEGNFDAKVNVANVILNRYYTGDYGATLIDVLNRKQFESVLNKRYERVEVTEDTKLACEYAFMYEDTTQGAIFFESLSGDTHQSYADYLFQDGYHKFYK